jgi:hypothetical protein
MTYSSGGLIQASDFNGFTGGNLGANVSGQINTIWGGGYGNAGYGQAAVSNVSVGGNVVATNWASLINTINSTSRKQTGSPSGLTAPTAGNTIAFLSTLSSTITNLYNNRLTGVAGITISTGAPTVTMTAGAGVAASGTITFTVTFASLDQARYWFNAGGSFTVGATSFTNTGGTARGTSIQTLALTNFNSKKINANSFGARTGSGGTLVTDVTTGAAGYYGLTTTSTQKFRVNSTSYYTGDYFTLDYYVTGGTTNGANGTVVTIVATAYSAAAGGSGSFNDNINVTLGMQLYVTYPATTYLTDTWGTPTVASSVSSTP